MLNYCAIEIVSAAAAIGDVPVAAMCTCTAMIRFFHPQMIAQAATKPGASLDQVVGFILAALAPRARKGSAAG